MTVLRKQGLLTLLLTVWHNFTSPATNDQRKKPQTIQNEEREGFLSSECTGAEDPKGTLITFIEKKGFFWSEIGIYANYAQNVIKYK